MDEIELKIDNLVESLHIAKEEIKEYKLRENEFK
jgi:hypothetical protein